MFLKDGVCNYKFIFFAKVSKSLSSVFLTPHSYFPTASPSCPSPATGQEGDAATTKNKELKLNLFGQKV
jgi:hypothetical protein